MTLVRWTPFREMEAMHSEMNRLFSRFAGLGGFDGEQGNQGQNRDGQWMLPVDIVESQDALRLKAALPGVDPQDVSIEVNDNVLTLAAQRRHEEQLEEGSYRWIEQQYGTFTRSLTLPRSADTEKIEARYNNGMLELMVPKKESAKPRRIAVQVNAAEPKAIEAGAPLESQ